MDLQHRLSRLKRLSPAAFPRLAAQRIFAAGRGVLDRALYTPEGPRRRPRPPALQPLNLWHSSVRHPDFAAAFRARFPGEARMLIETAEQALNGTIRLFGRPVDVAAPAQKMGLERGRLPWHADVHTGHVWDAKVWFSNLRWGAGADVRVPWELSRCGHFVTLGQAYVLTRDERFSKGFSTQLEDWIAQNPPKHGVNWAVSLEVALRAANWLAAWDLMDGSPALTKTLRTTFAAALWEHGRHVHDHLEWSGEMSTNHYLGNVLGLYYIGTALGQVDWWRFAENELAREIQNQTLPDGWDHEGSTAYHRFAAELFFCFALVASSDLRAAAPLARRDAVAAGLGPPFLDRLRDMLRLPGVLAAPSGRTPLIGDNDSARVHPFYLRDDADMRYLGDFAAVFLGDERARIAGTPAGSETAWLFGVEAAAALTGVGLPADRALNLRPGPCGIVTLRGARDAAWFLALPNGTRGIGNHTHNDKLSVLLSVGADDFLVDPGMPCYSGDPARRNRFRSTGFHSTVAVDGAEQNRLPPDHLFAIMDDAAVTIEEFRDTQGVTGSHSGYRRLPGEVIHRRSLERVPSPLRWIIEDTLAGAGDHAALWTFVCGPDVSVSLASDNVARLAGSEGTLEIQAHPASLKLTLDAGEVSPAYGVTRPTTFVRAAWKGRLPCRATFTLAWTPKEGAR